MSNLPNREWSRPSPRAASGTEFLSSGTDDHRYLRIVVLFSPSCPLHTSVPLTIATMASEGPDPQSLKSWEDAFQYPIPTVRRVEQELRRDIASNKEKLRALVG